LSSQLGSHLLYEFLVHATNNTSCLYGGRIYFLDPLDTVPARCHYRHCLTREHKRDGTLLRFHSRAPGLRRFVRVRRTNHHQARDRGCLASRSPKTDVPATSTLAPTATANGVVSGSIPPSTSSSHSGLIRSRPPDTRRIFDRARNRVDRHQSTPARHLLCLREVAGLFGTRGTTVHATPGFGRTVDGETPSH
jgi:hypothetical protein